MPSRAVRPAAVLATLVALCFLPAPHAAADEPGIGLGTAESFAVLAGEGIDNVGLTTITGDVGSHPNGAITGFGTVTQNGSNYGNQPITAGAKTDLVTAYDVAEAALPETVGPAQLGNRTLTAGVYTSETGAFLLTGTLTLDAEGVRDAQFVFKAGSTITTAPNSTVRVVNSADPCHVVWQIGSSATFDTGTTFLGDVLALTSISAKAGAVFEGRLLARNGAVTLINNTITAGACRAGSAVVAATPTPTPTLSASAAPSTSTVATPPATAASSAPRLVAGGGPGITGGGAGAPGAPGVPTIPVTGGWTLTYALAGLVLVALGVSTVRAGNGCRPGRHAAHRR